MAFAGEGSRGLCVGIYPTGIEGDLPSFEI